MKKELVIQLTLVLFFVIVELILLVPGERLTGFAVFSQSDSTVQDYSIQANCVNPITGCCDIVTEDTFTLNGNIESNGTCINITKSNVTLNCNGLRITYAIGAPTGAGINISDTDLTIPMENIVVNGCDIRAGSNSTNLSSQYGIWFNRPENSEVSNNNITTAGTSDDIGIYIRQGAGYSNFTLNRITTYGFNNTGGNYGIYGLSSNHNRILNNTVTTLGNGSINIGIFLEEGQNNTVQLNNISTNGTNSNHGIRIYNNRFNRILENRIKTFGNESTNVGILLQEVADGTLIDNNSIVTGGAGNAHGVFIEDNGAGAVNQGASHSNITNNTIITNGTGSNNLAIFASTSHHRIIRNNITTNGSADNHGIFFTARSQNNTVEANNVSINGTNSYGIFINDSNVSRFDNNTINITTVNFSIGWIAIVLGDGNNFTNTTFANRNGTLRFPNTFTPNGTHNITQDKLNITNRTVHVNSTNLSFLNASAQLTLINVTFSYPYAVFIGDDSGSGEECNTSQCIGISFNNRVYIFNVTRFTTYSASESNVTFSLTKTDSPDPVAPGATLSYAITFAITNGNATNITIHDVYDPNSTFASSDPTPVTGSANRNFSLPNFSGNGSFTVNITVTVNESFNGNLNNTALVVFTNGSGNEVRANVSELTEVRASSGGGGGRIVSSGGPSIRPKKEEVKEIAPAVQAPMQVVAPALTNLQAALTRAPAPRLVIETCKAGSAVPVADAPSAPWGYDVIGRIDPCSHNVVNIPDNFKDTKILRCNDDGCSTIDAPASSELSCAGKSLRELRAEERESQTTTIELYPLSGSTQQITEDNKQIVRDAYRFNFLRAPSGLVASAEYKEIVRMTSPIVALSHEVALSFNKGSFGISFELPYAKIKGVEVDTIAVAVRGKDWKVLEGVVNERMRTVKVVIDDVSEYLVDNKLSIVVIGNICEECSKGRLKLEYSDGVSRDALVLVHGLSIRSEMFKAMIDELALTNQPLQIWNYLYPYERSIDSTAVELAGLLEAHSHEFEELTLLGHSLGGFVVEQAVVIGRQEGYSWTNKLEKAIIVGTPHQGTPALDVFSSLLSNSLKTPGTSLFNLNAETIKDLNSGKNIPFVEGVNYQIIAGTKSIPFTEYLFARENDGAVTTASASTINGFAVNDRCNNYYDPPLNHIELGEDPLAIKVVERILNKENSEANPHQPLAGYNQYITAELECSGDSYFVIGKNIEETLTSDPLLCSCGNGVCGVGENDVNCPSDCAGIKGFVYTKYLITGILLLLLLFLLVRWLRKPKIKYPSEVLKP